MNKRKSLFLTFEGPEASGKSSQILLLENYLKKNKISFITTREPGGTKVAETLRNLILKDKSNIREKYFCTTKTKLNFNSFFFKNFHTSC